MKKSSYIILFIALIVFFSLINSLFLIVPIKLSAIFGVIILSMIEAFISFPIIVIVIFLLQNARKYLCITTKNDDINMRKRNLVLITIFFTLLIAGTFVYAKYTNEYVWREPHLRYHCDYILRVSGLSGREAQGTTVIMVPIPASKEGKFFTPSAQNEPDFIQSFVYEIEHVPEKERRGPYFGNMTEIFANKEIPAGKWVTFIAETEKGPMLGFRTNETRLEDINFSVWFVADHLDIFDPINNGSPLLFPVENISNISSIPYGDHSIYASNPTFDSYVYFSNNLKGGENISFYITLCANNDPTKFPDKYFGEYQNLVLANTGDTGYVKVKAVLEQDIPFGSNGFFKGLARYARDFYDKQNSHSVNETYPQ